MRYFQMFGKIGICCVFLLMIATCCNAADEDLANQYAPVWYFEGQECCYPVEVSYGIDNSQLYQFTSDESTLIQASSTTENLASYTTDDYYLDNTQGTVDDKAIIQDYMSKKDALGYTVYTRVVHQGNDIILQYWVYYAFNDGPLNVHEGDWELVQVVLTNNEPASVMFSQHLSGQQTTWDQAEHDGDHVKVYVARGTHANYLRSYSGVLGVANDVVGDNGEILEPGEYTIVLLENQSWLSYGGR